MPETIQKQVTFRKLELHEKIRAGDLFSRDEEGKTMLPAVDSINATPKDYPVYKMFWRIIEIKDI